MNANMALCQPCVGLFWSWMGWKLGSGERPTAKPCDVCGAGWLGREMAADAPTDLFGSGKTP